MDDWRRQGQERFLTAKRFTAQAYRPLGEECDHDNCEFCGAEFSLSEGDLDRGYSTDAGQRWVCSKCFDDFRNEFRWVVEE